MSGTSITSLKLPMKLFEMMCFSVEVRLERKVILNISRLSARLRVTKGYELGLELWLGLTLILTQAITLT